jgi:hypothetical protein
MNINEIGIISQAKTSDLCNSERVLNSCLYQYMTLEKRGGNFNKDNTIC